MDEGEPAPASPPDARPLPPEAEEAEEDDSFDYSPSAYSDSDFSEMDDVIELPEFTVNADDNRGYLGSNTMSATRLNQKVKELPIPVEVITSDFIADTGALDLKGALQFSAGLETNLTSLQQGDNPSETGFRLRGFISDASLRNGFRKIGGADGFNITQVDVVRGPNALLYGIGNFGGVVSYTTRRPSTSPRYSLSTTVGNDDEYRLSWSATGPVSDTLRYAVSGILSTSKAWHEIGEEDRYGIAPVVEWQPFKSTTILLDTEYLRRDSVGAENPARFLVSSGRIDPRTGEPVDYIREDIYPTINRFTGAPTQQGLLAYPDDEERYFRASDRRREDYGVLLDIIQQVGDSLQFRGGYYFSESKTESLNASTNLNSLASALQNVDQVGEDLILEEARWAWDPSDPQFDELYAPDVFIYNWNRSSQKETRHQFRVEGNYVLPINQYWENSFVFGFTYNEILGERTTADLADSNRPNENSDIFRDFDDAYNRIKSVNDFSTTSFDPRPGEFFELNNLSSPDTAWERGYYLIHQGTFWDNRVRSYTGFRYDWVNTKQDRATTDGSSRETRRRAEGSTSDESFSVGVSLSPRKDSPWAVYLLSASALQPIYNQTLPDGNIPDPTRGQSKEIGLKFDFFEGKVSGTIAAYEVEREGVIVDNAQVATVSEFQPGTTTFRSGAKSFRDDESSGVDMQAVFTDLPFRNLQTVFTASYNDYEILTEYGPSFVEFDPVSRQYVFEEVDTSDSTIDRTRRGNGTPEWTFKVWTKYAFEDGPLEGFDVGGGYRYTGEREATFSSNDPTSLITIDAEETIDLTVGYSGDFRNSNYTIRLNLFNITDEDEQRGYQAVREGFSWRLTTTVNF